MSNIAPPTPGVALTLKKGSNSIGIEEIVAGSVQGVYRTRDEGVSWSALGQGIGPVTSLAMIDDSRQDWPTLLAGGVGHVDRYSDETDSWSRSMLPSPAPVVTAFLDCRDPSGQPVILACTLEDGVFRSSNAGRTWEPANVGLLDRSILAIASSATPAAESVVIAGAKSGIFRSTNAGRSWRDCGAPEERRDSITAVMVSDGTDMSDQYMLAGSESGRIFRSTDLGETWSRVDQDDPLGELIDFLKFNHDLERTRLVAVCRSGIQDSVDAGLSWRRTEIHPPLSEAETIVSVAPLDSQASTCRLLVGIDDGVVRVVESNSCGD